MLRHTMPTHSIRDYAAAISSSILLSLFIICFIDTDAHHAERQRMCVLRLRVRYARGGARARLLPRRLRR